MASLRVVADTTSDKGRQRFSARGRTWLIVLRAPYGQPIDRAVVRWTGFSPMTFQYGLAAGTPIADAARAARRSLLLTTIGSRSGRLRTTVLPYFEHDGDLVICGTNGGGPRDPHWVGNIRADGRAWVRVDRRDHATAAHVAEGDERDQVFEAIAPVHGGLRRYQRQASGFGREIPLVVLRLSDRRG
jgi:deazaflavin-dependent oxidoreductase (nitroreductase family)